MCAAATGPPRQLAGRSPDSLAEEDGGEDEQQADQALRDTGVAARKGAAQIGLTGFEDEGADHRTGDRPESTDQREHRHEGADLEDAEEGSRVEIADIEDEESATDGGERRADDECDRLHAQWADAGCGSRRLIIANRDHLVAQSPAHDEERDGEGHDQVDEEDDHPDPLAAEGHLVERDADADRPTRPLEVDRKAECDLGEGERPDREERAAEAEERPRERGGDRPAHQRTEDQSTTHVPVPRHLRIGDRIGTDAEEDGMAEGELAAVAGEDVPCHRKSGEEHAGRGE
jgi:hypothetical protein